MRTARMIGVPSFNICYSMQLFTIANGGRVTKNSRGKERESSAISRSPNGGGRTQSRVDGTRSGRSSGTATASWGFPRARPRLVPRKRRRTSSQSWTASDTSCRGRTGRAPGNAEALVQEGRRLGKRRPEDTRRGHHDGGRGPRKAERRILYRDSEQTPETAIDGRS